MALSSVSQIPSIQAEISAKQKVSPGVRCRAGWRHTGLDGHVYIRSVNGTVYWVAVLQCTCGVWRITKYTPNTGQRVGGHKYDYKDANDYPKDLTQEECAELWLKSMLDEE